MTQQQVLNNYVDFICENVKLHTYPNINNYKDYMWGEKIYFWFGERDVLYTGGIFSDTERMLGIDLSDQSKLIIDRVLLNIPLINRRGNL